MKRSQGFTLIELLIVIAIIAILAAVLIPNLIGARNAAYNTAAQAHSSNVYTSLNGELAVNPALSIDDVITAAEPCDAASRPASGFGWNDPSTGVESCSISKGTDGDFLVQTTSRAGGMYVNGRAAPSQ